MSGQSRLSYGSSRRLGGGLLWTRKRLEALERAAQRYRLKRTQAHIQDQALNALSDEQLLDLVMWLRSLDGEGPIHEAGLAAWQAYQNGLSPEQVRNMSVTGVALVCAGSPSVGGADA